MSENTEMIPNSSEEYEAFLPEGWAEGDDIFDVDSWTGAAQADESGSDGQDETGVGTAEGDGGSSPAIESGSESTESTDEGSESRATETGTGAPNKFKFSAQIDHKMEEIEVAEDELPTLYQKAHVTDRVKEKLAKAQPTIDKGNRLAKMLGFASIDEMFDSAEANYRQGEIDKLTNDNVHPEVAEELVNSRMQRMTVEPEKDDDGTDGPRDFRGEVEDLLRVHSELRGQKLPDEVVNDAVINGRPLVRAYEDYVSKQKEAETKALKQENKTLKNNADAARRAPVRGVSRGGPTSLEPDDPFLKGFNSGY